MKVLKFGGSVLKDYNDIINIETIIRNIFNDLNNDDKIVLVFSAFYGITNKLSDIGNLAEKNQNTNKSIEDLKIFHLDLAEKLKLNNEEIKTINKLFIKIENVLNIIADNGKLRSENKDYLLSFGERLSNFIIASFLSQNFSVKQVSPCELIQTDSNFGCARVDFETSVKKIVNCISHIEENIVVCAGFFGADSDGRITTLGRNGSDYSASIIASALGAERLEILKDIDGLYTADPKIVKDAKILKQITYQEMTELSSLGNKVVHINAIYPCILKNIPILLKNCYNYNSEGTVICNRKEENNLINGIVKFDGVFIISFDLNDGIDFTDFAVKIQKLLKNYYDLVISITQNIQQKKILLFVSNSRIEFLIKDIENEFNDDCKKKYLRFTITKKMSLITIVGTDLSSIVGLSGEIFSILKQNNINIFSIQDDFSQTRISFICDIEDANKTIQLLHKELVK